MQRNQKKVGFTVVEMLIATILVTILSAASYKILTGQSNAQRNSGFSQKQNSQMNVAMDRFKKDAGLIDYNWMQSGVATVYPHQGLGLNENFYTSPLAQANGLSDGITFLKRNPQRSKLYTLKTDAEDPAPAIGVSLYNEDLEFVETTTDIRRDDWVLVYSPGKYALGVVTEVSPGAKIKIRKLSDTTEIAGTHMNSAVLRSSGYVTRAGVIPASYDWTGTNTNTITKTDDDSIKFPKNTSYVQVVQPVSYELDWATNDHQPAGNSNQHILKDDGTPKKMIVRTEYTPSGPVREYLAEANQLGFTYDALVAIDSAGVASLEGYKKGDIASNIGRENNSPIQFVNIANPAPDSPSMGDPFVATPNITSIHMLVGDDLQEGQASKQKFNEVQVALNMSRENTQNQDDDGETHALNSQNLNTVYNFANKKIGQPLYVTARKTGVKSPVDIVVPVAMVDPSVVSPEHGKLLVLDDNGASALASTSCSLVNCEEIKFQPLAPDTYFMPSTLVQQQAVSPTDMNKIFVGGFAVTKTATGFTRTPMMAEIEYPASQNFRDFVAVHNTNASTGCSLDSGCTLKEITTADISGSPDRLKDTNSISVDGKTGDVYVASLTRASGADPTLSIYKTDSSLTNFEEKKVDDTLGIATNRVVSAISQNPITVDGTRYLPIATTRGIKDGQPATDDGKILLYNLDTPSVAPIEIANHNFKVNSMSSVDGNLVFTGKLVTQVMKAEDIVAVIDGTGAPKPFWTDEIANHVAATATTPAQDFYADGFFTMASAYLNKNGVTQFQQTFGWNAGSAITQVSPMNYAVIMSNQASLQDSHSAQYEQTDFTTLNVSFGGMSERVVAAIDTNFSNLEASEVVTKFQKGESKIPQVLLPGVLYDPGTASGTPRTQVAPLPGLKSVMSEDQWVSFYQDYMDSKDHTSATPTTYLPDPTAVGMPCSTTSFPATC